jgi:hypothetical protein
MVPPFRGVWGVGGIPPRPLGSAPGPPIPLAPPLVIILHPSDGGPPCRLRDLQLFRLWAEQRGVGPRPGVELSLDLFNHPPDDIPFEQYSLAVWRRAVGGARGMDSGLVAILLMAGDAEIGSRISVEQTTDLVWFLAPSAFIITWMDTDRTDREDTTVVLPILPLCLEVTKMATNCISMDQGLPTKVALTLTTGMMAVVKELNNATYCDRFYCDLYADVSEADEESHPTPLF